MTVKLGERPSDSALAGTTGNSSDLEVSKQLGLSLQTLTPDLARELNLKDEHGVVITAVTAGSPADDAGLQKNDVIEEVDRAAVRSVRDFEKATKGLSSGESVALLVRRGANTFYIAMQLP